MPRRRRSAINSRSIVFPVAIALVLVVGIALIAMSRGSNAPQIAARPSPPPGVEVFKNLESDHVQTEVTYDVTPPVGGPHHPVPLTCAVYPEPVPSENAVHSLEHGAVWITHDAELSDGEIEVIRELAGERVVISPWEDLDDAVVASAWGRQLRLKSVDVRKLRTFVDAYVNGPQSPEPGAACVGVGTPG